MKAARLFSGAASVVCCLVAEAACNGPHREHFPFAEDCKGTACRPALAVGGGGGGPAASTAQDGGSNTADLRELDATVTQAESANLYVTGADSDETVSVSLVGRTDVSATVKGAMRIELPTDAFPGWLRVAVKDSQKLGLTLRFVDAAEAPLQLLTVGRQLYEDVATGLVSPVELDPVAGIVVLSIRDKSGVPVPRVSLLSSTVAALAQNGRTRVAYDFGDTFSDASQETGEQAGLLLLNLPMPTGAASGIELVLERNGVKQHELLPVEPGGATIKRVVWTGG